VNAARLTSGKEFLSWPSPRSNMHKEASMGCCGGRIASTGYHSNIGEAIWLAEYGLAAPTNGNTNGNHQGLSWATPNACDHKGATTLEACKKWEFRYQNLPEMVVSHWATPKTPTGGPETAKRKQELGRTASGGGDLASQANGKLNPRWVETLMGLPIGWTMPSCTSPQTIAPMSCDSSAMELSRPPQSGLSEFSLAS